MAGTIGLLRGFDYYYSASLTDSFYTAFPGTEALGNYSLQASNYFYLFSNERPGTVRIYRYYDNDTSDHFYTTSSTTPAGYASEGVIGWGFTSAGSNRVPIYRWYRSDHGDHAYTTSSTPPSGYVLEGIGWYSPVVVNGCSDPAASNYNPDVNQTSSGCTYSPPTVSFSASPTSIIAPASSTLSWTVTGVAISSVSINRGIGSVATSGTRSVSPTTPTTYTITATGIGGTTTRTVTVTASLPPPPTVSFSISPSSICSGNSATLSWNVTGNVSSVSINQGIGSVAISGTRSVLSTTTTTYTITATGLGGTTTRSVTLTVYQPSFTTLTVDNSAIIRGQSTTLRWVTTGDSTSATINNGIGAVNINGNRVVSPTVTTTYTINVTGICTNPSSTVTVIVYQPPTVNLTGPVSINYGQQATLSYTATNVDISLTATPTYNYRSSSVTGAVINLPIGTTLSGSIAAQIPYNDNGPFSVTYVIVATGNGGQESKLLTIPINIDETPTNFLVPETVDVLKSQDPVTTPDAVVTSYEIFVNDVDIPVEVKADRPILVEINNTDTWIPIREI